MLFGSLPDDVLLSSIVFVGSYIPLSDEMQDGTYQTCVWDTRSLGEHLYDNIFDSISQDCLEVKADLWHTCCQSAALSLPQAL